MNRCIKINLLFEMCNGTVHTPITNCVQEKKRNTHCLPPSPSPTTSRYKIKPYVNTRKDTKMYIIKQNAIDICLCAFSLESILHVCAFFFVFYVNIYISYVTRYWIEWFRGMHTVKSPVSNSSLKTKQHHLHTYVGNMRNKTPRNLSS